MQASNALARVRVESILVRERDQLRRRQQRVDDLTLSMESQWGARHRSLADKLQRLPARARSRPRPPPDRAFSSRRSQSRLCAGVR
jgi:hypothetical protein